MSSYTAPLASTVPQSLADSRINPILQLAPTHMGDIVAAIATDEAFAEFKTAVSSIYPSIAGYTRYAAILTIAQLYKSERNDKAAKTYFGMLKQHPDHSSREYLIATNNVKSITLQMLQANPHDPATIESYYATHGCDDVKAYLEATASGCKLSHRGDEDKILYKEENATLYHDAAVFSNSVAAWRLLTDLDPFPLVNSDDEQTAINLTRTGRFTCLRNSVLVSPNPSSHKIINTLRLNFILGRHNPDSRYTTSTVLTGRKEIYDLAVLQAYFKVFKAEIDDKEAEEYNNPPLAPLFKATPSLANLLGKNPTEILTYLSVDLASPTQAIREAIGTIAASTLTPEYLARLKSSSASNHVILQLIDAVQAGIAIALADALPIFAGTKEREEAASKQMMQVLAYCTNLNPANLTPYQNLRIGQLLRTTNPEQAILHLSQALRSIPPSTPNISASSAGVSSSALVSAVASVCASSAVGTPGMVRYVNLSWQQLEILSAKAKYDIEYLKTLGSSATSRLTVCTAQLAALKKQQQDTIQFQATQAIYCISCKTSNEAAALASAEKALELPPLNLGPSLSVEQIISTAVANLTEGQPSVSAEVEGKMKKEEEGDRKGSQVSPRGSGGPISTGGS